MTKNIRNLLMLFDQFCALIGTIWRNCFLKNSNFQIFTVRANFFGHVRKVLVDITKRSHEDFFRGISKRVSSPFMSLTWSNGEEVEDRQWNHKNKRLLSKMQNWQDKRRKKRNYWFEFFAKNSYYSKYQS